MTVDECIKVYTNLFEEIFEKQKHKLPVNLWSNPGKLQERFDSEILRGAIEGIVEKKGFSKTDLFNAKGERKCRVFVCATAVETNKPALLRDYSLLDESDENATIVESALATSAASTFFPPVTIGVRKYVDGALGSNNPVDHVWNEAKNIWSPDEGNIDPMLKCFISIGTGNPGSTPIKDDVKGFLSQTLKDIATDTERKSASALANHRHLLDQNRFFRYNVDQGLQNVGLEEYRRQPEIEAATQNYLINQTQKFSLRDCAQNIGSKQSLTPLHFTYLINDYNEKLIAAKHAQAVPKIHFLVPLPSNEEFFGREAYSSRIEKSLLGTTKYTKIALYGLGGIGKTRIALELAHKWKDENKPISVFWAHASTAPRFRLSYGDIAKDVNIAGWDSPNPEIDILLLVKNWLESKASGPWILILDNADDIDLFYGRQENASRLAEYLPQSSHGSILLTTRNKQVALKFTTARNVIEVPPLDVKDSVALLTAKVGDSTCEDDFAKLAKELDHVPLALVQAAAFISAQSLTAAEYLDIYNRDDLSKTELLSEHFEDDVRDDEIMNPVATTFAISFEHIKKSHPPAADILSAMSILDAQSIPVSLLPLDDDLVQSIKIFGTLQAFSLITKTSKKEQQDQFFDLHRLVRLAMRNWLNINKQLDSWTMRIIDILSKLFPPPAHENRYVCENYLPHALIVLSSRQAELYDQLETGQLLQETAAGPISQATLQRNISWYLNQKGDYTTAYEMAHRSLVLFNKVLGSEHQSAFPSISALASALNGQGKYDEAEPISVKVLELHKEVIGPQHPNTISAMANLAATWGQQGRFNEAEQLEVRVLELCKEVLGSKHPDTISAMGNLAGTWGEQGRSNEAEQLEIEVLELRKEVLGRKHPDTIRAMANLAETWRQQGRSNEAEQLEIEVLELRKEVLGPKHPDTISAMANLASIWGQQGRFNEAEQLEVRVLEQRKEVLGPKHPDTISAMGNLAGTWRQQGRSNEAEQLEIEVLEQRKEVLGRKHPDTIRAMANLAVTWFQQGQFSEAEQIEIEVLELRKEVLGRKHPDTILAMANLAVTWFQQGQFSEAEQIEVEVLELRKEVLGPKHPDTILAMANLAGAWGEQGRSNEAEQLEIEVLELRKEVLGRKHPDTIRAMANLAGTWGQQGRSNEAEQLEVEVLELHKEVLGRKHPDTISAMANLAATWGQQGRSNEAEQLEVEVLELRKEVLGPKHPDTILSMANLAATWGQQGRFNEAEQLEVEVLELCKEVLGSKHPDTILSMGNLAATWGEQGRSNEAEQLEIEVLELRKEVLGPKHPNTISAMGNLAATWREQGRSNEAEQLEVEVLELRKEVLGPKHPKTILSMGNLAATWRQQGHVEKAQRLQAEVLELRKEVLGADHPDTLT
ncbi:MAG: hypothetical protein M1829_000976 [Trizodia sp. TS-e1964]|nr:MAG: hypothetical protein M1829_000976 [Trizodia sp. TS-e1964]